MASPFPSLFLVMLLFVAKSIAEQSLVQPVCPIQSIYQLGDSISDTGNLVLLGPLGAAFSRLPYGESFHRGPTGRCSNGMLLIDYLAASLNLPLLNPYLQSDASFDTGVNFAVAGSTALDDTFFAERRVVIIPTNSPLSRQLEWFRSHLNSTCGTPSACANKLRKSIVLVGEIGGNDYNYFFLQRRPVEEIRTVIPHVVGAIANAVKEVIRLGAVRVVVPGNFPIGCIPSYLAQFSYPGLHDDKGCIRYLNEFALQHNNYLQHVLVQLRREFPRTRIVYSNYYSAFQSVLRRGRQLGFDTSNALRSCCGIGGQYNFNISSICGSPGVPVCADPDRYISWDGVHLTQNAYRHMSEILIPRILSRSVSFRETWSSLIHPNFTVVFK